MRTKDTGIITTNGTQVLTGNWTSPQTTTFVSSASRRLMAGVDVPNFHARKRAGELLPHTAFSQTEWNGGHQGGSYAVTRVPPDSHAGLWSNISNFEGFVFNHPYRLRDFVDNDADPTSPPPSAIPDYFLQQAAARIYAGGWDALTASVEAKKTVGMFKGVSSRMVNLARNFSSKRMLQLWLEGRYGWRTLAYDVRDLHDAVTNFDAKREIWTERAGTSYSTSESGVVATGGASSGDFTTELRRDVRHHWSLRGSVAGMIRPSRFMADPVQTAWELVPYSFVVDWVYDVGTWLNAMAFIQASTAYTASKGFECRSTVQYDAVGTPGTNKIGSAKATWIYEGISNVRSPSALKTTLPQVTGRAASWDLALDMQALATVRSRFR